MNPSARSIVNSEDRDTDPAPITGPYGHLVYGASMGHAVDAAAVNHPKTILLSDLGKPTH